MAIEDLIESIKNFLARLDISRAEKERTENRVARLKFILRAEKLTKAETEAEKAKIKAEIKEYLQIAEQLRSDWGNGLLKAAFDSYHHVCSPVGTLKVLGAIKQTENTKLINYANKIFDNCYDHRYFKD